MQYNVFKIDININNIFIMYIKKVVRNKLYVKIKHISQFVYPLYTIKIL